MVTLAIISAILFAIYLYVMAKLHGVQPSVSDNYYVSKHPWTFTLAMWTVFVNDCLYAAAAPTNDIPAQLKNAVN